MLSEEPPSSACATLRLPCSEVHVWRVNLDQPRERVRQLSRVLSEGERARTRRFFFERDRNRFVVCRSALRELISRYLDIAPSQPQFGCGRYGKPRLMTEFGGARLRFNLSHSGALALLAFTELGEIGIDVEQIHTDIPYEEIVAYAFSPRENVALSVLPENMRRRAFFAGWTCKEAYAKATGRGLSLPLGRLDISLPPGGRTEPMLVEGDARETHRWSLQGLDLGGEYAAAVVVEGHNWKVLCREWLWPWEVSSEQEDARTNDRRLEGKGGRCSHRVFPTNASVSASSSFQPVGG